METVVTPEMVEAALLDVLDGKHEYDIHAATGLPIARCEEIYRIYRILAKKRYK